MCPYAPPPACSALCVVADTLAGKETHRSLSLDVLQVLAVSPALKLHACCSACTQMHSIIISLIRVPHLLRPISAAASSKLPSELPTHPHHHQHHHRHHHRRFYFRSRCHPDAALQLAVQAAWLKVKRTPIPSV
jgi:hypothetical protein